MRGQFRAVWSETQREIWEPLAEHEDAPPDLYCELYRQVADSLYGQSASDSVVDITNDRARSREAFLTLGSADFAAEPAVVSFMERVHSALDDGWGSSLSDRYFELVSRFIDRFNLRYDLSAPCLLCPTLPGVFASLLSDIKAFTVTDEHLDGLMCDFESSVRDLRADSSSMRIKTCIQKQVNVVEGLGRRLPGVTGDSVGKICDQVASWPHTKMKEAMKNLYHFACDYPGIRHAGTPNNALRDIDMRDLVAVCVLLSGFSVYLTDQVDAERVYGCA